MTWVTVGGKRRDITKDEVIRRMRGVEPEPVREHLVEIAGTAYPPKQVLETVTEWNRRSFTSLEAVRVLTRVGFPCRRLSESDPPQVTSPAGTEQRLSELESALAVAQEAIARLANRVTTLEAAAR